MHTTYRVLWRKSRPFVLSAFPCNGINWLWENMDGSQSIENLGCFFIVHLLGLSYKSLLRDVLDTCHCVNAFVWY